MRCKLSCLLPGRVESRPLAGALSEKLSEKALTASSEMAEKQALHHKPQEKNQLRRKAANRLDAIVFFVKKNGCCEMTQRYCDSNTLNCFFLHDLVVVSVVSRAITNTNSRSRRKRPNRELQ